MKLVILSLLLLQSLNLHAVDRTREYESHLKRKQILTQANLSTLKNVDLVLVPGIVAESFIWDDNRSTIDLSLLFKEYFGAQLEHYKNLKLNVERLKTSSRSVRETMGYLDDKLIDLRNRNRPVIFITHSLGGLVLLDWINKLDANARKLIRGVVFIQSPFYGSPAADVYLENPYFIRMLLGPIIPFINTSEETIKYLSVKKRTSLMETLESRIPRILKNIKAVTAGGAALNDESIFRPTLNLIAYGCLAHVYGSCRDKILFEGPYDDSDGLVGFSSSQLPGIDSVGLLNVDHGEPILQMPYSDVDRVRLTDALLKLIL